ncbi:MAG: hypothetical protein IAF00_07275 [Phycisphaerales bacterium]|nr:hypothetical protein [Phycisphaerales bacterium]
MGAGDASAGGVYVGAGVAIATVDSVERADEERSVMGAERVLGDADRVWGITGCGSGNKPDADALSPEPSASCE